MDLRRLRAGEWIVAVSGMALVISLFTPWYGEDRSAWDALAVTDVMLATVAAAAVAVFLITATQRVPAVPIALEAIVTILGFVALILVAVRAIWLPEIADEREWGLWLALVAAGGIPAGAWIGMRDDRMGGVPPQPEAEPLPAPRP
jgi:hypothetical protein